MNRSVAYLLACGMSLASAFAAEGGFEAYYAFKYARPETIVRGLARDLHDGLAVTPVGQGYLVNFSGSALPPRLKAFLDETFDAGTMPPAVPVEFSLAVFPTEDGSELKLMLFNTYESASDLDLPDNASLLLSEGRAGACSAKLVLEHAEQLARSDATWMAWLREQGFRVTAARDENGTLFVGQRANCAVLVNIELDADEPGNTLVVVRLSED